MNFYPPSVNDYFLVTDIDGKNKCVANDNNCMVMTANKECTECYPNSTFNFLSNKKCIACGLTNCSVCGEGGKCKTCNDGKILNAVG